MHLDADITRYPFASGKKRQLQACKDKTTHDQQMFEPSILQKLEISDANHTSNLESHDGMLPVRVKSPRPAVVGQGTQLDVPVLWIKPTNEQAQDQFSSIAQLKGPHRKFIEENEIIPPTPECAERDVVDGYYVIRTSSRGVLPGFRFVIGRGADDDGKEARGVDVWIARSVSSDKQGVQPSHCVLYLHPESMCWMIKPNGPIGLNGKDIQSGTPTALSQLSILSIGGLQYLIGFFVETFQQEDQYVKARNRRLLSEGMRLPHTQISGIPFATPHSDHWRHQLDHGEFTSAYEDFDPVTGDLLIKKTIYIRDEFSMLSAQSELRLLEEGSRVGPFRSVRNNRGHDHISSSLMPQTIHIDLYKGIPLFKHKSNTLPPRERNSIQMTTTWQRLNGLRQMHEESWYHKGITPDSIVMYKDKSGNLSSGLIDLSRAMKDEYWFPFNPEDETYLPPEGYLYHNTFRTQDQLDEKLDIWMLGQALARSFFPGCFLREGIGGIAIPLNPRRGVDHARLMVNMRGVKSQLSTLLRKMMEWDYEKRPSAKGAMKHRIFYPLSDEAEAVGKSALVKAGKRKRVE